MRNSVPYYKATENSVKIFFTLLLGDKGADRRVAKRRLRKT
jgi:hypothetical protein